MKTFETKRGIEFDVEILNIFNDHKETHIELSATCEQGSDTFWVSVYTYGEKVYKSDFDWDILDCKDFEAVEDWVDAHTVSNITKKLAEICVDKSTNEKYYAFDVYHNVSFSATVTVMGICPKGYPTGVIKSERAVGEEGINELIDKIKKI